MIKQEPTVKELEKQLETFRTQFDWISKWRENTFNSPQLSSKIEEQMISMINKMERVINLHTKGEEY